MRRHAIAGLTLVIATAAFALPVGRAQDGRGLSPNFTARDFAERRAKIYDAIGPGAVALIQGAPTSAESPPFRQSNEFFYLSGVVAPQALLLMDGTSRRSTLYLPKQNARRATMEGEILSSADPAAAARLTGVEEVKTPDQLESDLRLRSGTAKAIYVPFAPAEGDSESPDGVRRRTAEAAADPWNGRISPEEHFRGLVKARAPALEI